MAYVLNLWLLLLGTLVILFSLSAYPQSVYAFYYKAFNVQGCFLTSLVEEASKALRYLARFEGVATSTCDPSGFHGGGHANSSELIKPNSFKDLIITIIVIIIIIIIIAIA